MTEPRTTTQALLPWHVADELDARAELEPQDRLQRIAGGKRDTQHRRTTCDYHEHPEWSGVEEDPRFQVLVPLSAGMDSLTAYGMALAAGLPARALYVDTGAAYSPVEVAVARDLVDRLDPRGLGLVELAAEVEYLRHRYVDCGRNEVIVWALADWLRPAGWGQLWFGNTAEWQETPVVGGDKSHRWLVTMQHLLTAEGHDLLLCSPLAGLAKADLVRWWEARGQLDVLLAGRSCYDTQPGHCGRCRSCFRRWLAFCVAGHQDAVEATYTRGMDWQPHVDAYRESDPGLLTMAGGRTDPVDLFLDTWQDA